MRATGPAKDDGRGAGVPFGRYAIKARLGRGGMGEVFLADQLGPRGPVRPVALKRVLPHFSQDDSAVDLFLSEMQTAAQLNHPNVATTYDFGEVDGVYFMAMEYVDGITLDALLEHHGRLTVPASLAIVRGIANALAHAHDADVIHQDVTPHNVMVSRQGKVKLLDFGIARAEAALAPGGVRAKIAYAAPEQLSGSPPDRRFDLWALGVVLYEAVTGRRPFAAEDAAAVVRVATARQYVSIADAEPTASDLATLIDGALQPDPDRRWSTAESFGRGIEAAIAKRAAAVPSELAVLVESALAAKPAVDLSETSATGVAAIDPKVLAALENAPTDDGPTRVLARPATTRPTQSTGSIEAEAGLASRRRAPVFALLFVVLAAVLGGVWWSQRGEVSVEPATLAAKVEPPPPAPVETEPNPVVEPPRDAGTTIAPAPKKKTKTKAKAKRRAKRRRARAEPPPPPPPPPPPTPPPPTAKAPADGLGLLSVRSVPWARVALDGKPLGEGLIANKPIRSGRHVVTLTPGEGGYRPRKVTFEIRPGVTTKIFADFKTGTVRVEP